MNKEYLKNNKKQKGLLKKYGGLLKKMTIGVGIALFGVFALPQLGIGSLVAKAFPFLNSLLPAGYDLAATINVWASIITGGVGAIMAGVNGIKAHNTKDDLETMMDEEEDLVDTISIEGEKNKEKAKDLEHKLIKEKERELESTENVRTTEKIIENYDKVNSEGKGKSLKK